MNPASQSNVELSGLLAQEALQNMSAGVSISDDAGYIVYTNRAEDQLFGYQPGELIGRHFTTCRTYPIEVSDLFRSAGTWAGECLCHRKDGRPFYTFTRISVSKANGKTYGIFVNDDITERKSAEDAVRTSERHYHRLFESTGEGILVVNRTGHYVDCNASFCRILKASRQRLMGAHFSEFIPPDRLAEAEKAFKDLTSGTSTRVDFPLRADDGSIVQLTWTSSFGSVADLYFTGRIAMDEALEARDETHREAGLPEDLSNPLRASLGRVFETGKIDVSDFELPSPLGKRHFQGTAVFEFPQGGDVSSVLSIVHDATGQKEAEEERRASEIRFQALADTAPVLIWMAGSNRQCVWFNRTWLRFTGQTLGRDCENGWTESIHPEDRERCLRVYRDCFDARENFTLEYRRKRYDGQYRWLIDTAIPMYVPAGEFTGYMGTCLDITDQKTNEQRLQETADRLSVALSASGMGDWSWDAPTDLVTLSERAAAILAVPLDSPMTGIQIRELLHPEDRERVLREVERATAQKEHYAIESRLSGELRENRWVFAAGRYVIRPDGSLGGIHGVLQDITERKALLAREQDARATAELLNSVGPLLAAELNPDRLMQSVTDLGTKLIGADFGALFHNVVNDRGESYMLYTLSGVPREAFSSFPMPRNTEVFAPTFRGDGILRSDDITKDPRYGKNAPYEGMPEGHLPVRSYLAAPVISRSGEVLGGLFFGHSQTGVFTVRHEAIVAGIAAQAAIAMDNARLFEQLRRERMRVEEGNMALRRANFDLEQFAYSASHDLQEPLRIVSIYSQMLKKKFSGQFGATADEYLSYTIQGAARLENLVRDLLEYTKASSL
ncbi:MAG TPA: PAS domain S-box protein, partial [Bryobacteraceae bacterium]|nr:PAS domain S-box protein [Bryobacteraceae bacterium]